MDYFLHALGTLFRIRRIYPPGKKQVSQAANQVVQRFLEWGKPLRITLLGEEAIIEDKRLDVLPFSFQAFFKSLRESGCESVQIGAGADMHDFLDWMDHVVSKDRSPYHSPNIITGSLNLESQVPSHSSALLQAVTGYLGFLSQTQEAISDLELKKPEGLARAREIVCAIATRLAMGRELFEPIRDLKNYDDYTFTHALNVCVLSSAIAKAMDLSHETVNAISLAGLCHDLGKKQIPREIVNKQGPLNPSERKIMEEHPSHGARLLIDIPGIQSEHPLLPVVAHQHHMGANYSGYPRLPISMQPHRLHFGSLIVSVADVYDALRTVRPYRPPFGIVGASNILIKDGRAGKLHLEFVSTFLWLLQVLSPGRTVILSDGSRGLIIETRPASALAPIIETENGQTCDLSNPSVPHLVALEDEQKEPPPFLHEETEEDLFDLQLQ